MVFFYVVCRYSRSVVPGSLNKTPAPILLQVLPARLLYSTPLSQRPSRFQPHSVQLVQAKIFNLLREAGAAADASKFRTRSSAARRIRR